MKSRVFTVLGLGALATTISLGAVQYVAASSDSTITVCANKSTGAMRLLDKGSCKKSEREVTWYKQSPQETTTTTIPATGRGVSVYDAADQYIGQLGSLSIGGAFYDDFIIVRDGVYFTVGSDGGVNGSIYFDGDNCTGTAFTSYGATAQWPRQLSQSTAYLVQAPGSKEIRWYRPNSGTLKLLTPASILTDYFEDEDEVDSFKNLDGVGKCYRVFDSQRRAKLYRSLELFTPPVVFKTNSPLKLTANK